MRSPGDAARSHHYEPAVAPPTVGRRGKSSNRDRILLTLAGCNGMRVDFAIECDYLADVGQDFGACATL
jgi:hypothetical protein